MKTDLLEDANGETRLLFHCPGCGNLHGPIVARGDAARPLWTWDGDSERPTLEPSIVVEVGPMPTVPAGRPDAGKVHRCHSFVRDGQIQFLGDCTHALAGQTVPLPDMED